MNFAAIDWAIVLAVFLVMLGGVFLSRSYMRSVVDFLAAGRSAGRYLLTVSQGIASVGAITVVATLEMNYEAGFALSWWGLTMGMVVLVVTASGWVIYRFRRTRSLTLAEFMERRYSRRFRVFVGFVAFLAGIINFGIFPAVGARFFIYFVGLPSRVSAAGVSLETFPLVMLLLLGFSLFFVFAGGQVTVILTDFIQGLFLNVVFLVVPLYLLLTIDWSDIATGLAAAPADASLVNPFKTGHVENFNFWYFLIGVLIFVYGAMSWQGTQAYNASATSAHEARMGGMLTNWRDIPRNLSLLLIPVVAYAVMHNPVFADQAGRVNEVLAGVDGETLRNQLRIPLVLTTLLPHGLMGAFAAVMLAAFVTTHDTYLHSWGSILIQDVVMPLRRRPFTPEQHVRYLRWAITGVAGFIFLFSLMFRQTQHIALYFAITGAIFFGGSGAVLIGGLYWNRGTTPAAWGAMLTGSTIAVAGVLVHQVHPGFFINGQVFSAIGIGASTAVYVGVSLLGPRRTVDLDRILHRGPFAVAADRPHPARRDEPSRLLRLLGMGREFTRRDRILYFVTYGWTLGWTTIFVVGTVYNLVSEVADQAWLDYWKWYLKFQAVMAVVVIVWFTLGGLRDVRTMLGRLKGERLDVADDGYVAAGAPPDEAGGSPA